MTDQEQDKLVLTATRLARAAHAGQFRRDGHTPYIVHPQAVVHRLARGNRDLSDTFYYKVAVAWLHDTMEHDAKQPLTGYEMQAAGIPNIVILAVNALTHRAGESYEAYLVRVKANPIALAVKIEDMLANLADAPTKGQIIKYAKGLLYLLT